MKEQRMRTTTKVDQYMTPASDIKLKVAKIDPSSIPQVNERADIASSLITLDKSKRQLA